MRQATNHRVQFSGLRKVVALNVGRIHADLLGQSRADARFGRALIGELQEASSYKWNHQGELGVGDYGKLVLDWSSQIFNRH